MAVRFAREPGPRPTILTASLGLVAASHTLRCDAKQAEERFASLDRVLNATPHIVLGDYLPEPFVKGDQPQYLEALEEGAIPVISTIAIQGLQIRADVCRFVSPDDFAEIDTAKRPRGGDVLLTMDGGVSIGKPAVFDSEEEFAVDSHVAILRPVGLEPQVVAYLLASPMGQLQFQRAESGSSGQTAVTEDDVRRFRFPRIEPHELTEAAVQLHNALRDVDARREALRADETTAWDIFTARLIAEAD